MGKQKGCRLFYLDDDCVNGDKYEMKDHFELKVRKIHSTELYAKAQIWAGKDKRRSLTDEEKANIRFQEYSAMMDLICEVFTGKELNKLYASVRKIKSERSKRGDDKPTKITVRYGTRDALNSLAKERGLTMDALLQELIKECKVLSA